MSPGMRITMRIALPLLVLAAMGFPARAEESVAVSPPGILSKSLRALGLESPPATRGDKAYRKGDYEEALKQYGKAAEETPNPPPLLYRNLGNALYRQKRYPEAADYYKEALKRGASDSAFAGKTHHNLGNALFRKAETADSTELPSAIEDARGAVENYGKSLKLNPGDRGSKRNLDSANALLQRLMEQQKRNPQQGQNGKDKNKNPQQQKGGNSGDNPDDKKGKNPSDKGDGDKSREDKKKPDDQKGKDGKDGKDGKPRDGKGEPRPGSMSEEEAKRLLNSFADDEKKEQAERRKVVRERAGTEQDW